MSHRPKTGASLLALLAACCAVAPGAIAEEAAKVDETAELPTIEVTARNGVAPALPPSLPATTAALSREQIREEVNAPTTSGMLRYLPSIEVRERFIGDRNGILSTRTTGTLESARSLVYADGILLSNLIGNSYSYPPRWGVVSPWEVERIDMVYGPFSAAYPGNSMGGVAAITTRMPDRFEAHAAIKGWAQPFELYGTRTTYPGWNGSLAVGNRFEAVSFWLGWDHLDAQGQPMSFANAARAAPSATATGEKVAGVRYDTDGNGNPRAIFGGTGIDHTVQDTLKLKVAWDIADTLRATYAAGLWTMRSDTLVDSYLRRADGSAWTSNATNGTCRFSVANGSLWENYNTCINPGRADATHLLQGLSLRSATGGVFDWEASFSAYDYLTDTSDGATRYGWSNAGTRTDMGGTGWYTADLAGVWRPDVDLLGRHEVSLGAHWDLYRLRSTSTNTSDWTSGAFASAGSTSRGQTQTEALHVQDAWAVLPQWTLTLGLRAETWRASDGAYAKGVAAPVDYAARSYANLSPKLSLAWTPREDLKLKASYGRAWRYPTVTELYQVKTLSSGSIVSNTPGLKPEKVDAFELSGEWTGQGTMARLSGFYQLTGDAIDSQSECIDASGAVIAWSSSCSPSISYTDNIGRVQIYGAELVVERRDVFLPGLDLRGSLTAAWSKVLEDVANPTYVGKEWKRIPRWRAKAVATWRFDESWSASTGLRYSSGGYNSLDNADTNWSTYGESSPYLIWDAKLNWKAADNWGLAFGVDNITDQKAYVAHPYPQRTFFTELKVDF